MATLTLRPNSTDSAGLLAVPSGDHHLNVDESVPDDTDYVYKYADAGQDLTAEDRYGLPDHTTESGVINSVTVKGRCKYDLAGAGSAEATMSVRMGGTTYYGTTYSTTTSWATYSHAWNTNPNSGVAWTWADIDNLIAGVKLRARETGGGKGAYCKSMCSQHWVEVDYTMASGVRCIAIIMG